MSSFSHDSDARSQTVGGASGEATEFASPLLYERRDVYDDAVTRELSTLTHRQLQLVGEDPEREGLAKTPERVAKAMQFLTHGYRLDPEAILRSAVFDESYSEMVLVRDIEVYSSV